MSSRSVVKSQRRCQADILGTTRSAEASVKYLLCYRLDERFQAHLGGEETNIGWSNRFAVPRHAEHPVAVGFCDEGMCTFLSFIGRNYIFYSSVAIKCASNT